MGGYGLLWLSVHGWECMEMFKVFKQKYQIGFT